MATGRVYARIAVAAVLAAACLTIFGHRSKPSPAREPAAIKSHDVPSPARSRVTTPAARVRRPVSPAAPPGTLSAPAGQPPQENQNPREVPPEEPISPALARAALSLVGADPVAETVWLQAINDPDRPAEERSDLIEDLNEEGFADPNNITEEDLPLIVNRLAIIEQFAPYAMDDVNAAAFDEAYKDLINMYQRLNPE